MQGNTPSNNSQRQLLMRCRVSNQRGENRERFIDHAEFDMWRYMLENKHGLRISSPEPCVWVPAEQCRRHDKLFARAAYNVPVVRLTYRKFDAGTGVTEEKVRYVLTAELDKIASKLDQHFVDDKSSVIIDTEAGEAISTSPRRRLFTSHPAAAYCAA